MLGTSPKQGSMDKCDKGLHKGFLTNGPPMLLPNLLEIGWLTQSLKEVIVMDRHHIGLIVPIDEGDT